MQKARWQSCSAMRKYIVSNALFRCSKNKNKKARKRTSKSMEPRAIENSGLCSYAQKTESKSNKSWNIPSLRLGGPGNTCLVFRTAMDQCLLCINHLSLFQESLLWRSYLSFITVCWVCAGQILRVYWGHRSQYDYKPQLDLTYITRSCVSRLTSWLDETFGVFKTDMK